MADSRLTCKHQDNSIDMRNIKYVFNDKEDCGSIHEREFVQCCKIISPDLL
jgi:hypothetical protein